MTTEGDRLRPGGAWASALSAVDFATTVGLGLEPLGFVQGSSVIAWNWYSAGSRFSSFGPQGLPPGNAYYEEFRCPHGYVSVEHRLYGANFEQVAVGEAWRRGFQGALGRLVEEAKALGAHGVIGIVDRSERRSEIGAHEFALQGTAVAVTGAPALERPFTTTLAGQKFSKLLEAGLAPVEVAATLVAVQVYPSCVTEYLLNQSGGLTWGGLSGEVVQLTAAHLTARDLARRELHAQLGRDALHGVTARSSTHEVGGLGPMIEVYATGNRVRRFRPFEPVPLPRPVVRLADR